MRRMQRAQQLAESCDLFLVIGSSLVVWPAAGFPLVAKTHGARLAIVTGIPPSSMRSLIWSCLRIGRCWSPSLLTDSEFRLCTTPIVQLH